MGWKEKLTAAIGLVLAAEAGVAGDAGNNRGLSPIISPEHGTVVLNATGGFTYTPDADFNGERKRGLSPIFPRARHPPGRAGNVVCPLFSVPADEVAAAAGTISYELFCALAARVPVVDI